MRTATCAHHPDIIQAALHFLMTRYQERPCRGLAQAVVHHLELLLKHPRFEPDGVSRAVYHDLLVKWNGVAGAWATASVGNGQNSVH